MRLLAAAMNHRSQRSLMVAAVGALVVADPPVEQQPGEKNGPQS